MLNATTMLLPVLDNDEGTNLEVNVLDLPPGVTATVEENQLRVTMNDAGTHVLDYRISNGTNESIATVTVVNLGSAILVEEIAFVEGEGAELTASENETEAAEPKETSVWTVLAEGGAPPGLRALTDLELPLLGFSFVGAPVILGMLGFYALSRRRRYVNVGGVPRASTLAANGSSADFELRHDAEALWASGRRRRGLIQVHTPNGKRWVPNVKVEAPRR